MFSTYAKHTALLNAHILFQCLYNIYVLIILKISISLSQYFLQYRIKIKLKMILSHHYWKQQSTGCRHSTSYKKII